VNLDLPFYQIFNIKQSKKDDDVIYSIIRLLSFDNYYTIGQANALCQVILFRWLESSNSTLNFSEIQYKTIKEAVYYINQNLDQRIKVSDLASKFNFSEKHFRNLFIKATGMSPKQYILNSKLDRATYLLMHSAKSIAEIAEELCFSGSDHLITSFKKKFKLTPLEYKNTHKFTS
jgi:AraC-like DNA-binding protein